MVEISLSLRDDELAEIDAQSGGDRAAFIIGASLDRARRLRREQIDLEVANDVCSDPEGDARVYGDWEITMADGLSSA